jgi:hypothetical protein
MEVISQPGWGSSLRLWTGESAQWLTGFACGADASLRFPEFSVDRLQRKIWLPRDAVTVAQRGLLIFYGVMMILGGDHLPPCHCISTIFLHSLAENSATVEPVEDPRERDTYRVRLSDRGLPITWVQYPDFS